MNCQNMLVLCVKLESHKSDLVKHSGTFHDKKGVDAVIVELSSTSIIQLFVKEM
jgi:hypothetical protein